MMNAPEPTSDNPATAPGFFVPGSRVNKRMLKTHFVGTLIVVWAGPTFDHVHGRTQSATR